MIENIRLSFRGIWSHKMRSFLTILGIIIGIASIISIVSTIRGTNELIKNNLVGAGDNSIQVKLYQGDVEYYLEGGTPPGIVPLSQQQKESVRNLETVKSASFYRSRSYVSVRGNQRTFDANVIGTDSSYLQTCGYRLIQGRNLVDSGTFQKTALLDLAAARSLFGGEDVLGSTIEIKGEPFIVTGIFEKQEKNGPVIQSMKEYLMYKQETWTGLVLIPSEDWPILYEFDEAENAVIRAVGTEQMTDAGKQTAELMNQSVKGENGFSYQADDLLKKARDLQAVGENTNRQLLWIAGISLLVGGIGVMNIMLVSVTERTREIGLKKAIGARKRAILAQFLTEAAVLTSMGGILGTAGGIGASRIIAGITQTPVSISIPACGAAVLFSMGIGIIFGLLPSMKAAQMSPIEALRHE